MIKNYKDFLNEALEGEENLENIENLPAYLELVKLGYKIVESPSIRPLLLKGEEMYYMVNGSSPYVQYIEVENYGKNPEKRYNGGFGCLTIKPLSPKNLQEYNLAFKYIKKDILRVRDNQKLEKIRIQKEIYQKELLDKKTEEKRIAKERKNK